MLDQKTQDIVIIGGGVVGVAIARELIFRHPTASITILDKEDDVAVHASGRNSGVIHAGFYYSPDSLKARLTAEGNRLLRSYCEEHAIPVRNTGKLVLASNEVEVASLHELLERGKLNGVRLEHVVGERVMEIEPRATNALEAIWSPDTAVSDPKSVVRSFAEDFKRMGGHIEFGCKVQSIVNNVVSTSKGNVTAGFVVNAAGLYLAYCCFGTGLHENHIYIGLALVTCADMVRNSKVSLLTHLGWTMLCLHLYAVYGFGRSVDVFRLPPFLVQLIIFGAFTVYVALLMRSILWIGRPSVVAKYEGTYDSHRI